MLVDANILLYAVDHDSPHHERARLWIESALDGDRRVGIPWGSVSAFLRIATNPRATRQPLSSTEAWALADAWLDAPVVWIPQPGQGHRAILGDLIRRYDLRANLIADATLAALCVEHGLTIVSADSDFARFTEIDWFNPVG